MTPCSIISGGPPHNPSPALPAPRVGPFSRGHLALSVAVVAGLGLALAVRVAFGPQIREDAYITLRYVEHIAAGLGFVYNPGEFVLGTTTPMFTLALAVLMWLGFTPVAVAFAVGVLCDVAAMLVLTLLAIRFLNAVAVVFVLILYALLSPIVSYAVSGMETSLYVLLILLSVFAYVNGRMRLTGLLLALLVLTRPDGLILAAVLLGHALLRGRGGLFGALIVFIVVLAPWLAFSTAYFGSPIPQSMSAKASVDYTLDRALSLRNFAWYFTELDNRWFLPLSVVFVLGLARFKRDPALVLLMGWALVYSVAFTVSNKFLFPLFPFEWYFVPLLGPYILGIALGLEAIISLISRLAGPARTPAYASSAAAAGIVLLVSYGAVLQYQHSELGRLVVGREVVYNKLAARMAEMGVQDELVAAYEIGAFGFYYPGPILDLGGLVSPEVVGVDSGNVLDTIRPPWIMSYADMLPDDVSSSAWFQREYKAVYALGNWEGRRATLYRRFSMAADSPPSNVLDVLGDNVELLKVEALLKPLGNQKNVLRVTFVWKALRQMDQRYTVFVHLRDGTNLLLGQHDGEPQGNEGPTTSWKVGETVVDVHDLIVDDGGLDSASVLVVGAYRTGSVECLLKWAHPTVSEWPHEFRLPLSSLTIQR